MPLPQEIYADELHQGLVHSNVDCLDLGDGKLHSIIQCPTKTERMINDYNNGQPNNLINALSWPTSTQPLLDFFGGTLDECKVQLINQHEFTVISPRGKWKVWWWHEQGRYFASGPERKNNIISEL